MPMRVRFHRRMPRPGIGQGSVAGKVVWDLDIVRSHSTAVLSSRMSVCRFSRFHES